MSFVNVLHLAKNMHTKHKGEKDSSRAWEEGIKTLLVSRWVWWPGTNFHITKKPTQKTSHLGTHKRAKKHIIDLKSL